jgi:ParB-like chromosome segregation protein Spo0J
MNTTVPLSSIVFRSDLYPRINHSPETVQKYEEDLGVLPPIEINQHNEIIDGWHRWTAHRKHKAAEIRVKITQTQSDAELLELAIERNASHGLQLSQADKRDMARRIYNITPVRERDEKKATLARLLSVSERTVREWLSRIDKDTKEERNRRIFELWMACYTQEEIAQREDLTQQSVDLILQETATLPKLVKSNQAAAEHATDFKPPIYNIWKQQERSEQIDHFGNTEIKWLDNLLYLHTQPFDVVVDPFAGGGSTIDLCKRRFRRYWVSDRKPVIEREKEIRQHDLTKGLPPLPRWKDVSLVYLDPPYWVQAAGKYSDDPTDLANMPLETFTETLADTIIAFGKKLSNAHIALVMQPSQWSAPDKQFTDHVGDMLRLVKLPVEMRYSVPYESQQYNAQMVDWAKVRKRCLVLTREIVVWKVQ